MSKKFLSTTKGGISADTAFAVAQSIAACDFRTAISRYSTGTEGPWVVSVSHAGQIGRFEIVEARQDGSEAELRLIPAGIDVVDIMHSETGTTVKLSQLIKDGFRSVNKMLEPSRRAA